MALKDITLQTLGVIALLVVIFAGGITALLYFLNEYVFELYKDPSVGFTDIFVFVLFAFAIISILFFSTALICEADIGEGCKTEASNKPGSITCKSVKFAYAAFFALIASILLVFAPQFFGYRSARLAGTDPSQQTFWEFIVESLILLGSYWMLLMVGILGVCFLEPVTNANKLLVK